MWLYNNKEYTREDNSYGFIYRITDDNGKMYIGKKAFSHRNKVKLSKKARVGTRKRVEIREKDSGWQDYFGSSKELLAYINEKGDTDGFKREIIKLCGDKASLAYWEWYFLITEGVLFSDNYWNGNVGGRFYKGKVHE